MHLKNIAFLRTQIQFLSQIFYTKMIQNIWLFYPDPHLGGKTKLRLTHPKFLAIYQKICLPHCVVHFKTDSPELFQFTCHILEELNYPIDFLSHHVNPTENLPSIAFFSTKFEKLNISNSQKNFYIQFKISKNC